MAAPPFSRPPSHTSMPPRIHYRLPRDIRHRYRRYRPGDLHRAGGRGGTGYGGYGQLAAGDFVVYIHNAKQIGLYQSSCSVYAKTGEPSHLSPTYLQWF